VSQINTERAAEAAPATEWPDVIEVNVTEEDINLGVCSSPGECAVARALRRTLVLKGLGRNHVQVGWKNADIHDFEFKRVRRYQHWATSWIYQFDQDRSTAGPITVTLVKEVEVSA
jgi:hypothetical protein